MDYWKSEFDSDEQQERRNMTRNTLLRVVKRRSTRRMSSSAVSDKVRVTDCCWLPPMAPSVTSTYMLGALSSGVVCLLNTSNLSKIYLFERDTDEGRDESRHESRRGISSRSDEAVSLDCTIVTSATQQGTGRDAKSGITHTIATSSGSSNISNMGIGRGTILPGRYILCLTRQRRVVFCFLDSTRLTESRRLRQETVLAPLVDYPARGAGDETCESPLVRFNASGSCLLVLLTYCVTQGSGPGTGQSATSRRHMSYLTVLRAATPATPASSSSSLPPYVVTLPWREIRCATALSSHELCYCGWWGEKCLLCLWSHGLVQLLTATSAAVLAEGHLFPYVADGENRTTLYCCIQSAAAIATSATQGILAVTLKDNVVACFTLHVPADVGGEGSPSSASDQGVFNNTTDKVFTISLSPTMQTYCSEDIAVRDIVLLQSFTTVVAVLLDSGAVLFLDATTMQLLTHMPLDRVGSTCTARCSDTPAQYRGNVMHDFFLSGVSKPFSFAVADHHTLNVLRP